MLLDTALRLFATRGVRGVSLKQINEAAGQKNASALHYYFGDRQGLLDAVLHRHVPTIAARRKEILAVASQTTDPRSAAEAYVLPLSELLLGDWRDRAFLQFAADMLAQPKRNESERIALVTDSGAKKAYELLRARLPSVPKETWKQRNRVSAMMVVHALGDHAGAIAVHRALGAADLVRLFSANLVDMYLAAMSAAVSPATALEQKKADRRSAAKKA